jgi:hypothetical protein
MAAEKKVSLIEFINPSRNYLTLITALIIFVCLAVSVGFGLSSGSLSLGQKWIFILFLMFFPLIGLLLSIWLILRHFRKLSVNERDDEIPWQIMSPDRQHRKLNHEVGELAFLLGINESQLSDLRSAYIVAEDLALRTIEQESDTSLKRHISLERTDFDAVLINDDLIKCIDVTFAVTPNIPQEKLNLMMRKSDALKKILGRLRPHTKLVLMVVIVMQLDRETEDELRANVREKFAQTPVDVDIRFYDFEELQKAFAS